MTATLFETLTNAIGEFIDSRVTASVESQIASGDWLTTDDFDRAFMDALESSSVITEENVSEFVDDVIENSEVITDSNFDDRFSDALDNADVITDENFGDHFDDAFRDENVLTSDDVDSDTFVTRDDFGDLFRDEFANQPEGGDSDTVTELTTRVRELEDTVQRLLNVLHDAPEVPISWHNAQR